jgi:hypothetical protein
MLPETTSLLQFGFGHVAAASSWLVDGSLSCKEGIVTQPFLDFNVLVLEDAVTG